MLPEVSAPTQRAPFQTMQPAKSVENMAPQVSSCISYLNNESNEKKTAYLAQQTGIELVLAKEFLQQNNWNLEKALTGYQDIMREEANRAKSLPVKSRKTLAKTGRGFSVSNMQLLSRCRADLDSERKKSTDASFAMFDSSSRQFFMLPNINQFSKDLGDYIRQDLISISTLQTLTDEGRLNWWAEFGACRKLFPLSTVGDGNCLLHAASLGMWGFHDRLLTLRKALHDLLLNPSAKGALRRRWKYKLWQDNMKFGGLNYSVEEWEKEWDIIVKLASDRPRCSANNGSKKRISRKFSYQSTGQIPQFIEGEALDSLEAIHVYAFSNLLCRPIIVIAEEMLKDSDGNPLSPIPFGGVYLPLERDPKICYKYPLVLAYNNAHFSALVPADGEIVHKGEQLSTSVPLYDNSLYLLPVHFVTDPGSNWDRVQDDSVKEEKPAPTYETKIKLLRQYLDIVRVPMTNREAVKYFDNREKLLSPLQHTISHLNDMFIGQPMNEILAARLNCNEVPKHYNEMIRNYIRSAQQSLDEINHLKTRGSVDLVDSKSSSTTDTQPRCSTVPLLENKASPRIERRAEKNTTNSLISQLNNMNLRSPPPPYESIVNYTKKSFPNLPIPKTEQNNGKPHKNKVNATTTGSTKKVVSPPETNVTNNKNSNSIYVSSGNKSVETQDNGFQFNIGQRCVYSGCKFYGSRDNRGYCSSCFVKVNTKQQ